MTTVLNYLTSFWTVVILNCVHPVNWEYCLPVHEWLLPEIKQGVEIYFDKQMNFLYKSEKELLENFE
jgi:hypothetical protein|tara:strand:+ start:350 stop:550 length:201 start_codon:yes stop_codon:yes gene_type:complete